MTEDLILELNRRGIKLRLTSGRIDVLAPAGSLTPELREQLRLQRDQLIKLLQSSGAANERREIVPQPGQRHEPFPLTDIQHAYWVGRNPAMELGGVCTHFYFELERDNLDPRRLSQSLNQVIMRHDMLRAVVQPDGQQRILPDVPRYEIAVEDLTDLPAPAREARLTAIRNGMAGQAPPPERWPLFEIRSSLLPGTRMRLHVSLNVLTIDAFSLSLLLRDWQRFYEEPGWSPDPLPLSYRDYVLAAESMRAGGRYRQAEEYWLGRLETLPPAPALPLARQPARLERVEFAARRARLAKQRWQTVKRGARSRGLTPTVVLVTAFADVLRLWSRQPSFTLNLTLFDRPPVHPRIYDLIGDFTSLTMLAVDADPGESFAARAARVQRQLMADLEHASFNGVRFLRERARRLGSGPDAAMPVVFTSAMSLNSEEQTDQGRAFFGDVIYSISQTPQVWLDHQVTEDRGELLLNWDGVEALFPVGLLDDMFIAYRDLLDRLGRDEGSWDTDEPLVSLPRWQIDERSRANDTRADLTPRTLSELALARSARTPDAVAVIADGRRLTYREVAQEAHRLARRLAALGVQRGDLVGIVLDKGWEQVPAVLGVTGSRAAYLPVDPSWPEVRRQQVLAEGGARFVVSSPRYRDELGWPPGVNVVTFDDPELRAANPAALDAGPAPGDLAYVIFTSGSTGRPKGVMINHRGAANTIQDINRRFGVGPADRVLALSALSFDLSVYDIFGTLAAGGAIVMPSAAGSRDPEHWTGLVERHGVTIWDSVPALMQAWIAGRRHKGGAPPSKLRLVMLSGDWIPVSLPAAIRDQHPDAEIISLGGATEASIWSVSYPIADASLERDRIPYGKPLANQTLHVYDERLEPCPVWTVGELYIGGAGLAAGYWADPRMTAERFITCPKTGERVYRTGDLGRYLPGGDIEFLGREDSQVKLNGYRVELGEIAAALRRQPGVAEALVGAATNPGTGRRQLVAHVVPAGRAGWGERTGKAPSPSSGAEPPVPHDADASGAWQALVQGGEAAMRQGLSDLGAEIDAFHDWWQATEALCPAIMARTLARLGVFTTARQAATPEEIVRRCGLKPQYTWLVGQWMSVLAEEGMLGPTGRPGEYRCDEGLDLGLLERKVTSGLVEAAAGGIHPALADYLSSCARQQVELLRGDVSPLELLIPGGDWKVTGALYADNPVSRLQNRIVATAVRAFVERSAAPGPAAGPAPEPLNIIEIGAGTGATTAHVLAGLPAGRARYRFTDISTMFIKRARQAFSHYPFVDYSVFDIDREPGPQGVPPGSAEIIVAANVLHDARDISRTLRHLRSVLAPGGVMVVIEGTANSRLQMISVAFIEGFSRHQGQREMPLLSAAQWQEKLAAEGFTRFAAIPGDDSVTKAMAQQVLVCQATGTPPSPASPARLRESLGALLPPYMVPRHYVLLDRLPLTANGKVDRSALPMPWDTSAPPAHTPPRDALEDQLLTIWRDVLDRDDFGVDDNFFELGGDSLYSIRILARLRTELGLQQASDDGLQALLECPTVATLAARLRELGGVGP